MKKILILFICILSYGSCVILKAETTTEVPVKEEITSLKELYNKNDVSIMPSIGNVNGLVVPIIFETKGNIYKENLQKKLDNRFNSDSVENGNLSVSKYYEMSSYGKLNIQFDIYPTLKASENANFYETRGGNRGSEYLVDEFFKENNAKPQEEQLDYDKYDQDGDGKLDALYLIYDHKTEGNFFWAYTTTFDLGKFNYPVDQFVFMSTEFFEKESSAAIHETGHLLGIDDYYDYDDLKGIKGGLGGEDIMDKNVGDHNPISKILLGWVTPIIIKKNELVHLSSFAKNGEVLVITTDSDFNMFSEYIIVDYLSFTSEDILNNYNRSIEQQLKSGIRVQRVDSTISTQGSFGNYYSFYNSDNSDTKNKFVEVVERDNDNSISKGMDFSNSDLYFLNDSLNEKNSNLRKTTKIEYGFNMVVKDFDQRTNRFSLEFNFYNESEKTLIFDFPKKVETKRNGKINFSDLKITDFNHNEIENYAVIGNYDANIPGTYECSIKASDAEGNIGIHYFTVVVTTKADLGLAGSTVYICISVVLVVGALGFIKVQYNKKYLNKK